MQLSNKLEIWTSQKNGVFTSRNLKSGFSVKQMPSWVNKDRITSENLSGIRMG